MLKALGQQKIGAHQSNAPKPIFFSFHFWRPRPKLKAEEKVTPEEEDDIGASRGCLDNAQIDTHHLKLLSGGGKESRQHLCLVEVSAEDQVKLKLWTPHTVGVLVAATLYL